MSGHVILASDVRGFLEFGLIEVDAQDSRNRTHQALTKLIERRLVLSEIDRLRVTLPPADRIVSALASVRSRFATESNFVELLDTVGFSEADLRQILLDNARLQDYIEERFDVSDQLTDTELRTYYNSNRDQFTKEGRKVGFEDIIDTVRDRFRIELRESLIEGWILDLRMREDVIRFDT